MTLARAEVFGWVDRVSIELTTQNAVDVVRLPVRGAADAARWSNVGAVNTHAGTEIDSEEKRDTVLQEVLAYFAESGKSASDDPVARETVIRLRGIESIEPTHRSGCYSGDLSDLLTTVPRRREAAGMCAHTAITLYSP